MANTCDDGRSTCRDIAKPYPGAVCQHSIFTMHVTHEKSLHLGSAAAVRGIGMLLLRTRVPVFQQYEHLL